ncbi:MAG: type II toxin-antitoxin system RelE/ParE family toxin [Flavobacterium sp.]
MSYHYILHKAAQQDYEEALNWYIERSEQAATKFVFNIDNALRLICNYPTRWRNEYKHYYELGVKKYPYTIIYSIEREKQLIIVSAIYHQKRNPKKKYRKII